VLLCFRVANAHATWRQAKVCLRPLSCYGQNRASRPPPLQHRVPIRAGYELLSQTSWHASAFPDRSGAFSDTGQANHWSARESAPFETSCFSLTAPGLTYEPLYVTTTSAWSPAQPGGETKVCSQPLNHSGWIRAPWAPTACPRLSNPSVALVAEGPFASSGVMMISSAGRRVPHHPVRPHGVPSSNLSRAALLRLANAHATWRQAQVCLRPLSCYGQDRASRPPPLQHRVPILALTEAALAGSVFASVLPDRSGTFSDQVGWIFGRERTRNTLFTPCGSWPYVWASLRDYHSEWSPAQPGGESKVCSQPLIHSGWTRAPWAPSTSPRLPQPLDALRHRRDLSISRGEVEVSSALADSRSISFVLTESQAMMWALLFCFRLANAIATWRQAKVCLRPLSSYGEDRASRPPPLQHRVPIRACIGPRERTPLFASVLPDRSGTFFVRVRWILRRERHRNISFQPHGSRTSYEPLHVSLLSPT